MSRSLKYIATASLLTVQLVDDETEEVVRSLTCAIDEVPDLLKDGDDQQSPKLYGIRKLLQERSSSEKDPAVKFESMLDTLEILKSGLYKSDEVKTRVPNIDPIFAQAVANIKGKPVAVIVASLQQLAKEQRDGLRANPKVAAEIERLKAEASNATAEDLLSID